MMTSDPWGLLLNQSGGGSIDMSRGFSGFGNLPPLDWMPTPGAEHGIDDSGKFPWNVADSYTYFRWYESVLFERAREEDRRLLLGDSWKATRMLLAGKFDEIQLDTSTAPRWDELHDYGGGLKVWLRGIPFAPRSQGGQPTAPPRSMPDWLEQFAPPSPLDPTASPPPAPAATSPTSSPFETPPARDPRGQDLQGLLSWVPLSAPSASPIPPTLPTPAPHWTTQTEWRFPAADPRLIQSINSVDTGNRPLNFVVNKVLLPWRNALAFAENIPLAALMGIDDALKRSAFKMEYQAAQDMMPLAPAMGLAMDVVPALAYAKAWMSTSQRVGAVTRGLGTVAKAPAYAFMGMGVGAPGFGVGKRAIPTLGPVLESALPSGERALPSLGPVLESALPSETAEMTSLANPRLMAAIRLPERSGMGYATFEEFKAAYGKYPGFQWHHIVEQNSSNLAQFEPYELHNTRNLILLPDYEHMPISAFYSSAIAEGGPRFRNVVSTWTFAEQHDFGIRVLMKVLEEL
jgi:hypothetical protein